MQRYNFFCIFANFFVPLHAEHMDTVLLYILAAIGVMFIILFYEIATLREQIQRLTRSGRDDDKVFEMYNFYDERGELKLSAKPEAVYYLESADNYVQIHYVSAGKMQTLMIRNSMKNIEWRFRDTSLLRCHRSFLVNLDKVQMIKRTEGEVMLDFNNDQIPDIPVGKAYTDKIMDHFAKEK